MPKINAASVAEHRAAQEAALLDAAVDLLSRSPERVPSLSEVGDAVGLSRSSVYHYFGSRDDLLAALVESMFPRWQRRVDAALEAAPDTSARVLAFVRVNLELVADGEHALAMTLATLAPGDHLARRSAEFHVRLLAPLVADLEALGLPRAPLMADLVNALILAGARRLEGDDRLEDVYASIVTLLAPALERASVG